MCIWMFRRLFGNRKGSSKKSRAMKKAAVLPMQKVTPTTQVALGNLEETERMLLKKQTYLEKKIKEEGETARSYATTNKALALRALARKRKFENQLTHNDGVLKNITSQRNALENASEDAAVLEAMRVANSAMHSAHYMDIDQVHELMDNIAEQHEAATEISAAIANPVFDTSVDEDELMRELEQLEKAYLDEQIPDVPANSPELPDVPSELPSKATEVSVKKKEAQVLQEP